MVVWLMDVGISTLHFYGHTGNLNLRDEWKWACVPRVEESYRSRSRISLTPPPAFFHLMVETECDNEFSSGESQVRSARLPGPVYSLQNTVLGPVPPSYLPPTPPHVQL